VYILISREFQMAWFIWWRLWRKQSWSIRNNEIWNFILYQTESNIVWLYSWLMDIIAISKNIFLYLRWTTCLVCPHGKYGFSRIFLECLSFSFYFTWNLLSSTVSQFTCWHSKLCILFMHLYLLAERCLYGQSGKNALPWLFQIHANLPSDFPWQCVHVCVCVLVQMYASVAASR
jgi:hypothetical protein